MGHRANFVIIERNRAQAHFDQWAALGCAHAIADGPAVAAAAAREFEKTDELLDWAWVEGGYLIDFDEKVVIVFGEVSDPEEDFGDLDDLEGVEDEEPVEGGGTEEAASHEAFLAEAAPNWKGWTMRWDERGVDAFAEHLKRRKIETIRTAEPSHPADAERFELRA